MSNIDYVKFKQLYNSKELMHHGVKGQKWGVRKEPEPVEKVDFDKAEKSEKRRNKKLKRTIGAIAIAGIIIGTVLANKYRTERLIADTKLTDDEIKKLAEKTIHDQRSDSAKKAAATRAANKAANAVKETINKGKDVANNVTKNIPKDTYIKDLLREARQKSSTFRDMKDMLHHSGINEPYLEHFGILGQKWGVRRYQNEDGSLTEAGKERYYKDIIKDGNMKKVQNAIMENKHISNIFLDSADKYEKYVKAKTNLYNNVEKKLDDIAYDSKYDFNNLPPYDENRKLWADTERKWASEIHNKYTEIAKDPNIEKLYNEVKETKIEYYDSLGKVQDSIIGKNRKYMGAGDLKYINSVINFNNEITRLQGLVKNIKDSTTSPTIDYVPYDKVKDMDPFEFIYGYTLYQFVD